MRYVAPTYGPDDDPDDWALAGLLHDADYERWPEMHPNQIVAWLNERGEHHVAHAISAHHTKWSVPHVSELDKGLLACDELTGFIVAYCRLRPGGIIGLKPKSVVKKLKDRSFAASVDRDEISTGATLLQVEAAEHTQLVLDALSEHREELELPGAAQ